MADVGSITQWIQRLQQGDLSAVQHLWNRYATQLTDLARQRLAHAPKGIADEDDIAQCVFSSLCRGAEAGRFNDLKSRDDLWWLLLAIAKRKTVDHIRREAAKKRSQKRTFNESELSTPGTPTTLLKLDSLIADEPTPDFIVMLEEQTRRLMGLLRDDRLRAVALSRIEGYSVAEIAAQFAVSRRSVERKLQLIRAAWAEELTCG